MSQSALPYCVICQTSFETLQDPVLFPCSHYLLCFPCCQSESTHQREVFCPSCNALLAHSTPDQYLLQLCTNMRAWLEQGYDRATAEASILPMLQMYIGQKQAGVVERHKGNLEQAEVKPVGGDMTANWLCAFCDTQNQHTSLRCQVCKRVYFGKVDATEELPESIQAIFNPQANPNPRLEAAMLSSSVTNVPAAHRSSCCLLL